MSDSTCLVCGVAFLPRPYGKPKRYCSREHYLVAANQRQRERREARGAKLDPCWACGKPCRRYGIRAFCDAVECRRVRNAMRPTRPWSTPVVYRNCLDCGRLFVGKPRVNRLYCDRTCAQRAGKRSGKHRRRTAERVGDNITMAVLGERDGWTCHLCRKPVKKRRGGDADSASIDHLIPISAGGSHSWANVALAHKVCNSRRHTGGVVQLRLV